MEFQPFIPKMLPLGEIPPDWLDHGSLLARAAVSLGRFNGMAEAGQKTDLFWLMWLLRESQYSSEIEGTVTTFSVFPKAEIQNCIVHQIRNSTKYVSYKDLKNVAPDLKSIYQAADQDAAETALDSFARKWDEKYPQISASWRSNWERLTPFFKYPPELRKIIYTTNSIEGFNRQLRKVTKSKSVFPTYESLLKMLYLAM